MYDNSDYTGMYLYLTFLYAFVGWKTPLEIKLISSRRDLPAALMSAVAVIGAKMSGTQQKADAAWSWLKRVWLAWAVINGIGAFIAYVQPLFDGYNYLP